MLRIIPFLLLLVSCSSNIQESIERKLEVEKNREVTKNIVEKNWGYISSGDMEGFKTTVSDDFKFILSGTLKWNDGRPLSRTYEGYDSFMNDFLVPDLETIPGGLIFHLDEMIIDEKSAAVIWHGESEALYGEYNNKYVYVYQVNDEGLVESLTEYTDLLLSASSLLGQEKNTNFKK